MVLRRVWIVAVLVVGLGCIHQIPPPVARTPLPVTVAYAFDHEFDHEESTPPERLVAKVEAALTARNLPPSTVPPATTAQVFDTIRDTQNRLRRLESFGKTPIYLLVEVKAMFLTASEGQYRWNVYVKLTAQRKGVADEPVRREFTLPATLQFDHEKEPEAVASQAETIADRAGALMDQILSLQPAPEVTGMLPNPKLTPGGDSVYFVLVDRFANGDLTNDGPVDVNDPAAWHGGDLAGVTAHLDWLQGLGVKTVWLSPIFKSRQAKFFGHGAFHGYWVEDFRELEPRFGNAESLRALANGLHQRGMRLLLDVVLNHTSFDSPLTRSHPDWFHHLGDVKDWNDPEEVITHDVMGLPDLAQEKPAVHKYLVDSSLKWADLAEADGFRLDAVRHVSMKFWSAYADEVRVHMGPQFTLLGELLDGDPATLAKAQRDGKFDQLFDFPLHYAMKDVFCDGKTPARLASVLSLDRLYANPDSLVTLLDNHDLPRILTACKGDAERVKRALVFQLTARGIPAITYGTEVGLSGEKEPQNRGDMRFVENASLYQTMKRLLALRRDHAALRSGVPDFLEVSPRVFAYVRVSPDEAAVIVVNESERAASLPVPPELTNTMMTDALTTASFTAGPRLTTPPRSVRVLLASSLRPHGFSAWVERARARAAGKAGRREVAFSPRSTPGSAVEVSVIGSAPEVGGWKPERAAGPLGQADAITTSLPVGSVVECKLLRKSAKGLDWEPGDNHVVFVQPGEGPQRVELTWGQGG